MSLMCSIQWWKAAVFSRISVATQHQELTAGRGPLLRRRLELCGTSVLNNISGDVESVAKHMARGPKLALQRVQRGPTGIYTEDMNN